MSFFRWFLPLHSKCSGITAASCDCTYPSFTSDSSSSSSSSLSICSRCGHMSRFHTELSASPAVVIDLDSQLCTRDSTVSKLADIIDEHWVVHIRGTPASGKTTLAALLYSHYRRIGTLVILLSGWPKQKPNDYRSVIVERAHAQGITSLAWDNVTSANIVVILDEGQTTYGNSELWLDFVKTQRGKQWGPRICILTSYGSPSSGPEAMELGSPLGFLSPEQRVSITVSKLRGSPDVALFFTRAEFDDVVSRMCRNHLLSPMKLATDACDYIWNLSQGHPGSVNGLVNMMFKKFPTLPCLVEEVIRNFSLRSLAAPRTLGTGAIVRPLEALYQDEFYAAMHRVLASSAGVTDFRITEPKWGVEILRDGERLGEHCARFDDGGAYKKWMDLGLDHPRLPQNHATFLWYAY
ncbi:hypothetical protein EX30DRAFT_361387 [Ascodesmis nigricans]|uniref:AAA+ ATPase domain-containing protein n=1 Tax=Ascodesmis nigricans TaxID=341454 RepID=A0A4S2N8B5_9PEZI|nr:hypothetical protein EX30DRAFT_361387 [Ascodesmis nigricans]